MVFIHYFIRKGVKKGANVTFELISRASISSSEAFSKLESFLFLPRESFLAVTVFSFSMDLANLDFLQREIKMSKTKRAKTNLSIQTKAHDLP
jgi:hypothetical protein